MLKSLEKLQPLVPSHLQLYVTFMFAFRDVVDRCLRMKLHQDWEASISHFSSILDQMMETYNTIESVKFHILRVSHPFIELC